MNTTNGHSHGNGNGNGNQAVHAARPVILLRARPGQAPETARVVHLAPLPPGGIGAVSALCGTLLCPEECETVRPGHGMPCSGCPLRHIQPDGSAPIAAGNTESTPPTTHPGEPTHPGTSPPAAAMGYQDWGWPVILRGDQVWLSLDGEVVALLMPVQLAATVTAVLVHRHSRAATTGPPQHP